MTYRSGVLTGAVATLMLAGAAAAGWWLLVGKPAGGKPAPPPVPASVPKVFKEDQAAGVTLTPEAEARLAIRTAPADRPPLDRGRSAGSGSTAGR